MKQKSGTSANRNIVPGEETYSEALQNKQPERRNSVDNSLFLSTKEFPTLMNSFGILETTATKQLNEDEKKNEEIKHMCSTTARKRPTTTEILGDSIIKGIQGHKMKEAINHSNMYLLDHSKGPTQTRWTVMFAPPSKKHQIESYSIVAQMILNQMNPLGSLQKTSLSLQNKWKVEKLRSLHRELFREHTNWMVKHLKLTEHWKGNVTKWSWNTLTILIESFWNTTQRATTPYGSLGPNAV